MTATRARSGVHRRVGGFTIMEIAIALAVMSVLAAGILVPLVSQLQQRNVSVTEKTLNDIKDALTGFAAVNGRLPCPAVVSGTSLGAEAFDPAAGNGPGNGKCASFWGYVPARTLGITPVDREGFALDGWNNRIRYAVANEKFGTPDKWLFTSTDGIRNFTISEVAKIASLLHVCDSGVGVNAGVSCATGSNLTPRTLTSNAVVVVWSIGPNGLTTGGTGYDEAQNPNPKNDSPPAPPPDRLFVSHAPSDSPANPFDDVVTWLSINTLVNRMVGAGQLP